MKLISLLALIFFNCVAVFGQTLSSEEAAKKIADATPAALPQRLLVGMARSDAQRERLKGKVRSVVSWAKDSGADSWQRTSLQEYDENSYLIKTVSFDHSGNPNIVRVYGYIDDKRVSSAGFIGYPYDPPGPPGPPDKGAPRDYRYTNSYEFKYDPQDRLTEQIERANNGKVIEQIKYVYDDGQVKRLSVNSFGEEVVERIDVYGPKGELLRMTRPAFSRYGESRYEYRYDAFDAMGNWLERTITGKTGQWGGKQKDSNRIEKREITYH